MSLFWDVDLPKTRVPEGKAVVPGHVCDDKGMFALCKTTQDEAQASEWLLEIGKWPEAAFDYETTGVKPHKKGHEIVCVSFSNGLISYAFPIFRGEYFLCDLREVLEKSSVKKIAHNIRFEASWTENILGYKLDGLYWDTMIAEHILSNNSRIGIKCLVEKYFGITDYEAEMSPFLAAPCDAEEVDGKNAFNFIHKAPMDRLLLYNAMDSLMTFKLYELQKKKMTASRDYDGFQLLLDGTEALRRMHENGIRINMEILGTQEAKARRKMERISIEIAESKELKKWDWNTTFNFNSTKDLPHLLFDILGVKSVKTTDGGKPSVDEDALSKMKLPITELILSWRQWKKASGTYLAQFKREQVDGIVRSFLNLTTVDTFRSSGDSPNIQNIYKRDPEMKKFIRSFIVPSPGNRFIEYDYKAAEVCLSACYNKDPTLLSYVRNPASDMHRDVGCQLFIKTTEELTKEERSIAKNGFVFPVFYGSYYKKTAPAMYEDIPESTRSWLKTKGVGSIAAFIKHVQRIEEDFWGNRFPVYAKWKNEQWALYEKTGVVPLHSGFTCTGKMDRKQVSNYPVQGAAFHCLLWYIIRVQAEIDKRKMKSKLVYEIHDALVADVVPEEEEELDQLVWEYGTQEIIKQWPWIIVPLTIEKERSAVNGSWAEMEGCGVLKF